jgi:tetratricopeptide (TPR) repeat protein
MAANDLEPYVGPRPFEGAEQMLFFGRDAEAADLLSLVIAHPVVALYSPSGGGKTSLLNAKLLPSLRREGFDTLPAARVQWESPGEPGAEQPGNVYVHNVLKNWGGDPRETLAGYLGSLAASDREPSPRVVVFDQFEELFTLYPERWKDRRGFFEQVRDALDADSRLLRVVFSMREDYVAELDSYSQLLPERLRTRYRLERLRRGAALAAVTGPLEAATATGARRRRFAPGVAEKLVDNLLTIRVKTPEGKREDAGEFVEPVQLQVVCRTLWKNLGTEDDVITEERLKAFGDVNQALASFYEEAVRAAVEASSVTEGRLRNLFEETLITPAGTRGIVFRGARDTAGIPNAALNVLEAQHVIRAELRGGERWYELSHDRLIEPIRESNKRWMFGREAAVETRRELEERAARWAAAGRSAEGLLDEAELPGAARWLEGPDAADLGYSRDLYALVQASRAAADKAAYERELAYARQLAEERSKSARRLRSLVLILVAIMVMTALTAGYALKQQARAVSAGQQAIQEKSRAEEEAREARESREEAMKLRGVADAERERAAEQARLALLHAEEAEAAKEQAIAARRVAEVERHRAVEQSRLAAARQAQLEIYQRLGQHYRDAFNAIPKMDEAEGQRQMTENLEKVAELYLKNKDNDAAFITMVLAVGMNRAAGNREMTRALVEKLVKMIGESESASEVADMLMALSEMMEDADNEAALSYSERAVSICHDLKDLVCEGRALGYVGRVYYLMEDNKKSLGYYERSLLAYEQAGKESDASHAAYYVGNAHFYLRDYPKAAAAYERALGLYRKLKNQEGEHSALTILSTVYEMLGDKEKALEFKREAEKIDPKKAKP